MFRFQPRAILNAGGSSAFSARSPSSRLLSAGLLTALALAQLLAQGDYQKGVSYYRQGEFAKVIAEFEPIVKEQPEYEFGHRILGLSYLKTKQYEKAIVAFQNALRLKNDNFSTYTGLALAYFNSRRFGEVLPTLEKAEAYAKTPQDQYQLHHIRGAAAYQRQEWARAAASLEKAVSLRPGNADDILQLGIALFQLGRYDQARPYLEQAAALRPEGEAGRFLRQLQYRRGVDLIEKGRYQGAADLLSDYVESNPGDPQAWFNLGLAYLFTENLAASREAFQRTVRLEPGNGAAWQRLGYIHEKQKRYSEALEAYQMAFELTSKPESKEGVDRIRKRLSQGG